MSTPDTEPAILLLIKMMKMTTAEDNIALVAIRKANEVLKREGWDWEALLRSKVTIIGDPFAGIDRPAAPKKPPPQAPVRPQAPPPRPTRQPPQQPVTKYTCIDCGQRVNWTRNTVCNACDAKRQSYAAKAAQTAKQRRKNPMTLDDIL